MSCSLVTSIVLKNNVTLVDIVSSRMLGQYGESGVVVFCGGGFGCLHCVWMVVVELTLQMDVLEPGPLARRQGYAQNNVPQPPCSCPHLLLLPAAGFLATVFDVFRSNQVSVDVVATSEVSISLSLDPKKCMHDGEVRLPSLNSLAWVRGSHAAEALHNNKKARMIRVDTIQVPAYCVYSPHSNCLVTASLTQPTNQLTDRLVRS